MSSAFDELAAHELQGLAEALRSGRVAAQPSALALQRYCGPEVAEGLARELGAWSADPRALADLLDLLARERAAARRDVVDLVWSGPEVGGVPSRDTGAAVRDLFAAAAHSVLVAGYAVHRGREVFRVLAERMDREPGLAVRMFLDVRREPTDTTIDADIVRRFAQRFRDHEWPGQRLPDVHYDPRSLAMEPAQRSALHAKCVVVDRAVAFVSSANFTVAAQTKNIEVGAVVRDRAFAERLAAHFEGLVRAGALRNVTW